MLERNVIMIREANADVHAYLRHGTKHVPHAITFVTLLHLHFNFNNQIGSSLVLNTNLPCYPNVHASIYSIKIFKWH